MDELNKVIEKVITILTKKDELTTFQLVMATGAKSDDVYKALRNLAREEKIRYVPKGNSLRVFLSGR